MKLSRKTISSINYLTDKTYRKILSFRGFPTGWHYGEGKEMNSETIAASIELLSMALNRNPLVESDAFPGIGGEVRICFYIQDEQYEFTVEHDLSIEYVHERNDTEVDEPLVFALEDALEKMASIIPYPCPSPYAYSQFYTTSPRGNVLPAWLSNPAMTGAVSPWLTRNVFSGVQQSLAGIYANSILVLGKKDPYSYDSIQQNYPLKVVC